MNPGELQSVLDTFFFLILFFIKKIAWGFLEAKVAFIRKLNIKEKQIWPQATHA